MILHNRLAVVFVWVGLALLSTACSQSAFSPTSPSGNGRGGSSGTAGATITGSVNGVQPSLASSSEAVAMATKPVTVTVVGTGISSTIDGSGRFRLNDVPTGDVQLKFVDRKSTRLNSSHSQISYAVFCLKKKKKNKK